MTALDAIRNAVDHPIWVALDPASRNAVRNIVVDARRLSVVIWLDNQLWASVRDEVVP